MCATRARKVFQKEAKERQGTRPDIQAARLGSSKGQARDKAGEAFGVSGRSVERAVQV